MKRHYSATDAVLMKVGEGLKRLAATARADVESPAARTPEAALEDKDRAHAAGLMRVNHAGEVAAQALYLGQALTARETTLRDHLLQAADEERSHLAWCEQRLRELGEGPSRLQPLWFAGSFAIGAAAGLAGDRWSLGFVEETEKQVCEHLETHLQKLPKDDARSRRIVEVMRDDEARHGRDAAERGARELPAPVRAAMRQVARIMKRSAYWF